MDENKPLDETEQAQLIEIMQIFMQLPNRDKLTLQFYADASGSLLKDSTIPYDREDIEIHFHDLEEGVTLMRAYANPEQEDGLFLPHDPTLE